MRIGVEDIECAFEMVKGFGKHPAVRREKGEYVAAKNTCSRALSVERGASQRVVIVGQPDLTNTYCS